MNKEWRARPFVPQRLVAAREFRGMEKRALAKMGFAVTGFESGKKVPDRAEVVNMAMVLGFPPGWFTKPWDAKIDRYESVLHICESHVWCDEDDGCGERAVSQCDYPIAGGGTCDKNICANHGRRVGANRDYCDTHLAKHRLAKPGEARTSSTTVKEERGNG